jgi:large repetitive protein
VFAVLLCVGCDTARVPTIGAAGSATPDASLRALTMSAASLSPAFDSAKTSYVAAVTATTATTTVTPAATSSSSTIAVNGTIVASGATSPDIALAVGTTLIIVAVTAEDGVTTRTYTITVTRAST